MYILPRFFFKEDFGETSKKSPILVSFFGWSRERYSLKFLQVMAVDYKTQDGAGITFQLMNRDQTGTETGTVPKGHQKPEL